MALRMRRDWKPWSAPNEIDIRTARLLTLQAAQRADLNQDFRAEASIAKLVASEAAGRVVDRVMQIFGDTG
jgi:acyl-CoA dehydrogenase